MDVMQDSGWDWNLIHFDLPSDVKLMLQATPITLTGRGNDRLAWVDNPRGIFDLKSAYSLAMGVDPSPPFSACWLWKSLTLPRIKTFLWMYAHNSIGVKECLARRGVVNDEYCPICRREAESILRAIKDCPRVQSMWRQLGVQATNRGVLDVKFTGMVEYQWEDSNSFLAGKPPWKRFFLLLFGIFRKAGIVSSSIGRTKTQDWHQT